MVEQVSENVVELWHKKKEGIETKKAHFEKFGVVSDTWRFDTFDITYGIQL